MSAHVLLNDLLNELRKSDQMRCLSSILSLFRNKFNKFNHCLAKTSCKRRESYMSAHVLFNNLLNDFFATSLINSIIVQLNFPAHVEDLTGDRSTHVLLNNLINDFRKSTFSQRV